MWKNTAARRKTNVGPGVPALLRFPLYWKLKLQTLLMSVKRLTAFAACVDGNSVMACAAKQRAERSRWRATERERETAKGIKRERGEAEALCTGEGRTAKFCPEGDEEEAWWSEPARERISERNREGKKGTRASRADERGRARADG